MLIQAWEGWEVLGKKVWDLSYPMNTGSVFLSSLTPHLYVQDMGLYNVRFYIGFTILMLDPSVSDACNRCKQSPANLIHMLWEYPKLFEYWTKIF